MVFSPDSQMRDWSKDAVNGLPAVQKALTTGIQIAVTITEGHTVVIQALHVPLRTETCATPHKLHLEEATQK